MLQVNLKQAVHANIRTDFAVGLGWIKARWELRFPDVPFTISSLKDGRHGSNSQHKQNEPEHVPGEAADLSTLHSRLWTWTDGDEEARYKRGDGLSPGVKWADVGRHVMELSEFQQELQEAGFRVVIHPEQAETIPHLHVALGPEPIFRRLS